MSLKEQLEYRSKEAEQIVFRYLPEEKGFQKTVLEAMDYSVRAGGKRLRPVIMKAAYELCGGSGTLVEPFMAALEMIHSYSLVHDDLPEMDNDELRRGKPTTHIMYGQAMAVLAGDGLLNYAYETAISAFSDADEKERAHVIRALTILAGKAGVYGMVGGQCLDVEAEEKDLSLSEEALLFVYENKTAALLQAAFLCGAALAGAKEECLLKLEKAGYDLGIAFQLQDDILDIEGSEEELGKPIGSDERNGKKTYVSCLGLERAKAEQERLSHEAAALVAEVAAESSSEKAARDFLTGLIEMLVSRKS
ncbi:MAG: polyprenyl synthetase family protein [Lachnospiraceae bacterium]|nr:polyprenyl synthetase family protein [Lachnospiraceae bacterium]